MVALQATSTLNDDWSVPRILFMLSSNVAGVQEKFNLKYS